MREIKFRVWDKVEKIITQSGIKYNKVREELVCGDNQILMQFTGLKDKNGIKIYEGDIVDFGITTNIKEVVFDEESASFRIYEYLYEQGSALAEKWFLDDCEGIEVIGNIYENPELLETK